MSANDERRPRARSGAQDVEIVPAIIASGPHSPACDTTSHVAPCYVAVVRVGEAAQRHYRRHVYLNLPAATRVVERARARGQVAEVVLCELRPIGGAL